MLTRTITIAVIAVAIMLAYAPSVGAWTAEDARSIAQTHKDAVVNVQLVVETSWQYEGDNSKRESKASATGTVIDPSGLVVASLTETDTAQMMNRFMGDEGEGPKMSSRTVDVKIRLADGTEIPADVVLRDRDLDLTFIRPKKAVETPMAYIDLSQASAVDVLDELLVLSRMGAVANRALAQDIHRVRALVSKPRTFYVLEAGVMMNLGGPALTMDGKIAGILLMRMSPVKDRDASNMSAMGDMMTPVVLPCSTIIPIAEQAKNAKPIKEEAPPAISKPAAPTKPAAPAPKKPK